MSQLTANDLKTRGIAAIESARQDEPETLVTVRGQHRYVVMDIAQYHYLRECALDAAQARAGLKAGRVHRESPQAHVKRVRGMARHESGVTDGLDAAVCRAIRNAPCVSCAAIPISKASTGLQLLEIDPHHPSLHLRALSGRLPLCIRCRPACRTGSRWSC